MKRNFLYLEEQVWGRNFKETEDSAMHKNIHTSHIKPEKCKAWQKQILDKKSDSRRNVKLDQKQGNLASPSCSTIHVWILSKSFNLLPKKGSAFRLSQILNPI